MNRTISPSFWIVVLVLACVAFGMGIERVLNDNQPVVQKIAEESSKTGVYLGNGKLPLRTMLHADSTIAYSVFCENGVEVRAAYRDGIITEVMNEHMSLVPCKEGEYAGVLQ